MYIDYTLTITDLTVGTDRHNLINSNAFKKY